MKGRTVGAAEQAATWMGIAGNVVLFAAKMFVGFTFNSIAIISDSFNSLTDIVASTIVLISIRSSYKGPDASHPFGHARAQPLAGLVVAILTGIVGFEIITQSFGRLFDGGARILPGLLPLVLLAVVMVVKLVMHIIARVTAQKTHSTALMASAIDHRNDVLISIAVLCGVGASNLGYPIFDPLAAMAVGTWIIWAGFRIGRDNIKYLMGAAPPAELVQKVKAVANATEGVLGLNDVFAHYVGTSVEVEIHIDVDKSLTIEQAHAIGKKVQWAVEDAEEISRAFIHIDPLDARARP